MNRAFTQVMFGTVRKHKECGPNDAGDWYDVYN
jgi:hypothetical protein